MLSMMLPSNNSNINGSVYGSVIIVQRLRDFTQFILYLVRIEFQVAIDP